MYHLLTQKDFALLEALLVMLVSIFRNAVRLNQKAVLV